MDTSDKHLRTKESEAGHFPEEGILRSGEEVIQRERADDNSVPISRFPALRKVIVPCPGHGGTLSY